jgi:hypothetical protein
MKHRSIDFDVEEAAPHKWRSKIYPTIEDGPKIVGGELFDSRTMVVIVRSWRDCHEDCNR